MTGMGPRRALIPLTSTLGTSFGRLIRQLPKLSSRSVEARKESLVLGGDQMSCKRRNGRWRSTAALTASVVLAGLLQAAPASAHDNGYGWYDCTQKTKLSGSSLRVSVSQTYPFPASVVADGVDNSFASRIADAAARWDYQVRYPTVGGKPYGVTWVGTATGDIHVSYRDIGSANGVTKHGRSCSVHGLPRVQLPFPVYIDMDVKGNWFTQDDSRRAYWEDCASRSYTPTYTCSKTIDFGGSITHEIGHAIGIPHPWDVSSHIPGTSTYPEDPNWANCGSNTDPATMCYENTYRSSRRTLHRWDLNSLRDALNL